MLNTKEVISTVNQFISKNSGEHYNSLTLQNQLIPNYNHGLNSPIVCSLKLDICKSFYKRLENKELCEERCPFGFTVCKKSFNTSSSYKTISIFSIVKINSSGNEWNLLSNLPRRLKTKKQDALDQLHDIYLNEETERQNKVFLEGLLETLLIGRIGLSIQSISHQFFTPLQGAMSDVKNLENEEDQFESLQRLGKNLNSLDNLATQIQLILSTSQEFNYNMLRRITVHSVVNNIYQSLQSLAYEKNLDLKHLFNSGAKSVDAIPSHINIVLQNIIHNAIKYSYNGQASNKLPVITSYKMHHDSHLVISVVNEGCEITKEEIRENLLFNLSYRGVHSGDRQRSGSGSGLYVSNEIVRAHGGKITVDSKYCGGDKRMGHARYRNTFCVYWPIIIE